jgi:glycosyltransferase involved in cell wall biosynthesis
LSREKQIPPDVTGVARPDVPAGLIIGVLPTFRRQEYLATTLAALRRQTLRPHRLIVVDNEGSGETERIVRSHADICDVSYVRAPENMGFAGGVALGMRHALRAAEDDDWIVLFDDDDPPRNDDVISVLHEFAREMREQDSRTAAVGISGGWFDWRRGRMRRVPDRELIGAVPVDHVAGNQLPFFLVRAIRDVGPFSDDVFFGLSELEFGLRLWRAGYSLYGHGPLWLEGRTVTGRLNHTLRPSLSLEPLTWRRYYTLRNLIFILRRFGKPFVAVRVTIVQGFGKPMVNLFVNPNEAWTHLRVNARACRDGWFGRMGRRVEPDGSLRSSKARPRTASGDRS